MRLKLLFILGFLLFSASASASATDFTYETSFVCGPKKYEEFTGYKNLGSNRWKYYFVHTAKNGNFVILHDDIQFTNFRDTFLNQLYFQNGGTFRATMNKIEGVSIYRLVNKEDDYVKTFNVNLESMTFISRVTIGDQKFAPLMGICWIN